MGRVKENNIKATSDKPTSSTLSPSERIHFLANLIIDRIIEDQNNGRNIFKKINHS